MRRPQPITRALGSLEADIWATTRFAGFGLVLPAPDGRVRFEIRHAHGVSVNLIDPSDVPPPLRLPIAAANRPLSLAPHLHHDRAVDRVLARRGLDAVCATPVEANGDRGLAFAALDASRPFAASDVDELRHLADRLTHLATNDEPDAAYESWVSRVDLLSGILPALGTALDIRDTFTHLSAIARRVMPHDSAIVGLHGADGRMRLHVLSAPDHVSLPAVIDNPYPGELGEGWLFTIHRDLAAHAGEDDALAGMAGFRSAVRVAIGLEGRVGGVLDISSFRPHQYNDDDVAVAMRLAEYVTLVLSHQRLADAARKAEALRERAANLEMLEGLLDALSGVLDIREVFDRISAIAHKVLPHDAVAIAVTLDDPPRLRVHALSGFGDRVTSFETPMPEPWLLKDPWEYRLADFADDPRYAESPTVRAGMRSVLCVPVRLEGRLHAALNFYSRSPGAFTQDDVIVARRIRDHVTLAFSHQRLAEEAQRTVELRSATASLETLDDLLAAETGAGDLADVFDRVSAIAQKVLPHDTLVLPVALPDGTHARVYASGGAAADTFPDVVEIPDTVMYEPGVEYDLIDDLRQHPVQRYSDAAKHGYRSALRVPVRLEDRYAGALVFLSFECARYKHSDVMVAHRIADRVTLVLARDRRLEALKRADEATARAAQLESRVRALTDELDTRPGFRRIVGESPAWREILMQATRVAATETTVLLRGESGTGKEIVARFVHRASARHGGPFVALNCAALPEHLLEAELFGYDRGAFTGATQNKPGHLEQAARGTLFLDEVSEMSLPAQAKFLRVLQEREFQRLGGTRVLRSDARVIAATNHDLEKAIAQGRFREDLFYRLNVFAIRLPPLRERREDILPLTDAFLSEIGRGLGRPPSGIARDARARLHDYHWPGNVRELRNLLERAAILCDGGLITADHLALSVAPQPAAVRTGAVRAEAREPAAADAVYGLSAAASAGDLKSMERMLIDQALQKARFNKSRAAKALGLTRAQLYVRMRRHGLE